MKRGFTYYLAGSAILLASAGVFVQPVIPVLAHGQPMDEVEFDMAPGGAAMTVQQGGLEIISGNDPAMAPSIQVLAGFNTRASGTEIAV